MITTTLNSAELIRTAKLAHAKAMVRENLENSVRWLVRAILAIYARQTSDEQTAEQTNHDNERGFNAADAPQMSGFAKQILQWEATPERERRYACPLSPKQIWRARQRMRKYAGQLVTIARGR